MGVGVLPVLPHIPILFSGRPFLSGIVNACDLWMSGVYPNLLHVSGKQNKTAQLEHMSYARACK
jgi:hypothetical protein